MVTATTKRGTASAAARSEKTGELALEDRVGAGSERFVAPILQADGTLAPGAECPLDDDALIEALTLMTRSRLFDERALSYQRQGRIGTYAEARGQEAASTGSALTLDPSQDWVVQSYREQPALFRQGMSMLQYWLLLIGHPSGGVIPADVNITPMQIELSTQLLHGVGLAWGNRIQRKPGIVIGYIGDGATSEGDFYEAGNLAAVCNAPIVLFCQNNGWAISTPRERQTAASTIAAKSAAWGMPGYVVDGNDVLAVYAVTREAVARARRGDGPTFIEAQTYRLGPHNTSDDHTRYSSADVREQWRLERDPIARLQIYLTDRGVWNDDKQRQLTEATYAEIDSSFKEASSRASQRSPGMLFDHVYANPPARVQRQRELWEKGDG